MVININNNGKSLLTTKELARLLNIHINTVRRWSDRGFIKTYRIGTRGDRRFDKQDILHFLQNNDNPS